MKFRPGNIRRNNVMGAVACFAGHICRSVFSGGTDHLWMERVLPSSIDVARQAVDRGNGLFMWNILRIKACMACDASQFSVWGLRKNGFFDVDRAFFSVLLHGHAGVTVACETVLLCLSRNG
ncbi:MAG: hypothetical protein WEB37_06790 [Bacteroidota bacterium]